MLKNKKMMGSSTILMFMLILLKMLKNFENKIMVLIMMEAMFITTIFLQSTTKSSALSLMFLMNIMIFMVLDSTMGLSMLISMTRNSVTSSQQYKSI